MKRRTSAITFDREIMTETERCLLRRDVMRVAEEYFDTEGDGELDLTRTEEGFSVCLIFRARRIKKAHSPQ